MKFNLCLIILCWLATSAGWAQKAFIYNSLQKNGFVSADIGTSLPTGEFSRTGATDGMAAPGRVLRLSGGYRLAGPLGLMARFESTTHGVRAAALARQHPLLMENGGRVLPTDGSRGRWQTRSLMIGPYVSVPMGRLALDVRALAGQVWATCPEMGVEGTINTVETSFRSGSQTSTAIGSGLGLTLRYRITPSLGIQTSADYGTATLRFNKIPLESRSGALLTTDTYNVTHRLTTLNLAVGVTLQFRSKNRVM